MKEKNEFDTVQKRQQLMLRMNKHNKLVEKLKEESRINRSQSISEKKEKFSQLLEERLESINKTKKVFHVFKYKKRRERERILLESKIKLKSILFYNLKSKDCN